MNKLAKFLLIAAATFLLAAQGLRAADPDQPTLAIFNKLMVATSANDYDGFIAECDDTMKAALTKPQLEGVSKQIGPRVNQGYDAQYLGELKQHGFAVHLWRLSFKDGKDDVLATMSLKDGKVGGFYLH